MAILVLRSKAFCVVGRHLVQNSIRTMSGDSDVILEKIGNKGVVTLNRPSALNSLSLAMINKMYAQLVSWNTDPSIEMIIAKGSTEKSFCAGGDVVALVQAKKDGDSKISADFFRNEYRLNNLIGTLQVPYVALMNGITMGGGVGLSVHGNFRVCTDTTLCAMPEAAIGFFPDVGGGYFLPKLPGKIGKFMALTGYRLKGRDVFKGGIATHFVTAAHLKDLESTLMRLENPSQSVISSVLHKFQEQCEIDDKKEFALKEVVGRINTSFGADSVEDIIKNLENDGSEWSRKQLEIMHKMSPTSLKVTFEHLKRVVETKMTLRDTLNMEYRISQKFMQGHDFYEGVRSVLIDKDNQPKWNPSKLSEVTDEQVNSYFEPFPEPSQELRL